MNVTGKAPGVYIEEIPATGPIAGVSTSTAAFIGPTLTAVGLLNRPTLVTNWTQFKNSFGDYSDAPRLYLPHAVRGFFDNGGTNAYIVAVASARAFAELDDRAGANPGKAIRIESRSANGTDLTVEIKDDPIVAASANAKVVKAKAPVTSASATSIQLQNAGDAQLFQRGDWITIDAATGSTAERAAIDSIQPGPGILVLKTPLTTTYPSTASVRIADLASNQKTFRIQPITGIEAGSVVHLAQGTTQGDFVVDGVMGNFVNLAKPGLTGAFKLGATDPDVTVTTWEFTLTVNIPASNPAVFAHLSMDQRHSRYFRNVVNNNPSSLVNAMPPGQPSIQPPPNNLPKATTAPVSLAPGLPSSTSSLGVSDYQLALDALTRVDGVNLVCAPDAAGNTDIQQQIRTHCETMRDRFAIFDPATTMTNPPLPDPATSLVTGQRPALDSNNPTSGPGFGALYFPWIVINDPVSGSPLNIPPSGHIAGIYARVDDARGVHKAPANEFVNGAINLERVINDADQGVINELGINALRIFPGQARPQVWGARTTAPKDSLPFRYVNVRRLFLFVEKSIQLGIRWAVFEPNDLSLWKKLDRTISEFLTRVWRSGALFGKTADQAFYVKIDEELNPPDQRDQGIVTIEIGIAPVRPAEFVIVQIAMWDGGSTVTGS